MRFARILFSTAFDMDNRASYRRTTTCRGSESLRETPAPEPLVKAEAIADAARELLHWTHEYPERSTSEMRSELLRVIELADARRPRRERTEPNRFRAAIEAEIGPIANLVYCYQHGTPFAVYVALTRDGRVQAGSIALDRELVIDGAKALLCWFDEHPGKVSVEMREAVRRFVGDAGPTSYPSTEPRFFAFGPRRPTHKKF